MRTDFSCCSLDGVQKGAKTKVCPKHRYHKMACRMVCSKSLLTNVVKTFPIWSQHRESVAIVGLKKEGEQYEAPGPWWLPCFSSRLESHWPFRIAAHVIHRPQQLELLTSHCERERFLLHKHQGSRLLGAGWQCGYPNFCPTFVLHQEFVQHISSLYPEYVLVLFLPSFWLENPIFVLSKSSICLPGLTNVLPLSPWFSLNRQNYCRT